MNANTRKFNLQALLLSVTLAVSVIPPALAAPSPKPTLSSILSSMETGQVAGRVYFAPGSQAPIEAKVEVPFQKTASESEGLAHPVMLSFAKADGQIYAECELKVVRETYTSRQGGLSTYVLTLLNPMKAGASQPDYGVCDVDPAREGVQAGVPLAAAGDVIRVYYQASGLTVASGNF